MRIAIVGCGYVGLVAAACFAELGHDVICVDNDREKIAALNNGILPIHEVFLPELVQRHRGRRLAFSDDLSSAVRDGQVVFIAVGTPQSENGEADLSYFEGAVREIAHSLQGDPKIIVEKSTVPVYTSEWIRLILAREGAEASSFEVASNPEFLREGTAVADFLYPDRIVIGADSERTCEVMRHLYEPLTSGTYPRAASALPGPASAVSPPRLIITSTKSAELIKHASNAFLAMKLSFVNSVANVCESVGADIEQVCEAVGADSRIGPRFMKPGIGYGGSCFPKDLLAFGALARAHGCELRLLDEVARINDEQRQVFLKKVRNALWTLKGKRLAALGLAFKGGTDDIRESPAVHIVNSLHREGATVVAYDPAAMDRARQALPPAISFAQAAYDAAQGADALLILTDWEEFAALDLDRLRRTLRHPIVIDGRNLYSPHLMLAKGFTYASIGRAQVSPISPPSALPARGALTPGPRPAANP